MNQVYEVGDTVEASDAYESFLAVAEHCTLDELEFVQAKLHDGSLAPDFCSACFFGQIAQHRLNLNPDSVFAYDFYKTIREQSDPVGFREGEFGAFEVWLMDNVPNYATPAQRNTAALFDSWLTEAINQKRGS